MYLSKIASVILKCLILTIRQICSKASKEKWNDWQLADHFDLSVNTFSLIENFKHSQWEYKRSRLNLSVGQFSWSYFALAKDQRPKHNVSSAFTRAFLCFRVNIILFLDMDNGPKQLTLSLIFEDLKQIFFTLRLNWGEGSCYEKFHDSTFLLK